MLDILGMDVIARTKDGPVKGMVREVMSRQDAERILGIRAPDRLRKGKYLQVSGVGYPIRRSRCKVAR